MDCGLGEVAGKPRLKGPGIYSPHEMGSPGRFQPPGRSLLAFQISRQRWSQEGQEV